MPAPLPVQGLYRTSTAMPGHAGEIPAGSLVFVGVAQPGDRRFVVRPHQNRRNRWFWTEPTLPLDLEWSASLVRLREEGFYTLPEDLKLGDGGLWVRNAIVQLGYNREGRGILFVGEWHEGSDENVLRFSDHGVVIDDDLVARLHWAPILPVAAIPAVPRGPSRTVN